MNIEELRSKGLIIFECISGSTAYGLNSRDSDVDIKGVFVASKHEFYGFDLPEQVTDETNDIVYYELKKFMSLLSRNNPGILEMLYTPEKHILHESQAFREIRSHNFLSKLCRDTFAGYAMHQIKKARGLNKKIMNPMPEQRLGVLDFCYITHEKGSEKASVWLDKKGFRQEDCGLAALPHFPDVYLLYHSPETGLRGIIADHDATDVRTSSIPKHSEHSAYLHFNAQAFKVHCNKYKEYQNWTARRNPVRYKMNVQHGKNYDTKNMMHVFRLLQTAEDIARNSTIDFSSYDRDFLLKVKSGDFSYDELITLAEKNMTELKSLFDSSSLPDRPDIRRIEELMIRTREMYYSEGI
ncbi:MAG: nucleotidyltransferase domain-containing protein [Deltaproteobacteria bacterium]|nr:nucleotidyltransferase domain-containing protein [Deltaproteobacteria bacterium]